MINRPDRLLVRSLFGGRPIKDHVPSVKTLGLFIRMSWYGDSKPLPNLITPDSWVVSPHIFNEYDLDAINAECPEKLGEYEAVGPLFMPHHARSLFDDVERFLPECRDLVVACDAGLARSPAIATAFNDCYGWDFRDEPWNNSRETRELHRKGYLYRLMKEEAIRRGLQ